MQSSSEAHVGRIVCVLCALHIKYSGKGEIHLVSVWAQGRCEGASQAEVCHLDSVGRSVDEDVLWLQIAMQDSVRMTELHCLQDLIHV